MSDLISTLADQLLALINSKPQSPSKAEIEDLIRAPLTMLVDEHHLRSHPLFFVGPDGPPLEVKWGNDITCWSADETAARLSAERQWKQSTLAQGVCPLTTSGTHNWGALGTADSDVNVLHHSYRQPFGCACGARKP